MNKEIKIQVILGVIIILIGLWIPSQLKPSTDIDVSCKISEGLNANYTLEVFFNNKADFSGKNFFIYLWSVETDSYGTDYFVDEQCERIREIEVDSHDRVKFHCDFIPPNTVSSFDLGTDLTDEIIEKNGLKIEWWGETTPHKKEFIKCNI